MTDNPNMAAIEAEIERLWDVYSSQGMNKKVGFGERPAVLSVDMIRGFTEADGPMGLASFGEGVAPGRRVLDAARSAGVPVVLVGSTYDPEFREAGAWERKVTHRGLVHGSEWTDFDPGLGQVASDHVIMKRQASGFHGTDLLSHLIHVGADTVIVTGSATSGCVRATAVDALQNGFRVMVVKDAVADRERLPHLVTLFDLGTKYADLVTVQETVSHLEGRRA
jgi:maleamate amidohydrolase